MSQNFGAQRTNSVDILTQITTNALVRRPRQTSKFKMLVHSKKITSHQKARAVSSTLLNMNLADS